MTTEDDKVQEYADRYGEFELYNAISDDPRTANPDGSINGDYVYEWWSSFFRENPDAPI